MMADFSAWQLRALKRGQDIHATHFTMLRSRGQTAFLLLCLDTESKQGPLRFRKEREAVASQMELVRS